MSFIVFLILAVLSGLVVGALGRLVLPGRDPMSVGQTILVGMGGSLVAGLIAWFAFGHRSSGLLLSVLVAAGIVYAIRRSRGG